MKKLATSLNQSFEKQLAYSIPIIAKRASSSIQNCELNAKVPSRSPRGEATAKFLLNFQ